MFGAVLGSRSLRRLELAFSVFCMAEWATWIAILVFAFERGGATQAGIVAVVQLVPSAIVAPFASLVGDRHRRVALPVSYLAQGMAMGGTGLAIGLHAPIPAVYVLAAVAASSVTLTRPVQGALLPSLTRTPAQLTAANVVTGTIENLGFFVGPVVAGVLLSAAGPGAVFLVMAGLVTGAAVVAASIDAVDAASAQGPGPARAVVAESVRGFRALARDPGSRLVVALTSAQSLVIGALDVLAVALAIGLLGLSRSWPGFFAAALGVGGVLGAAGAVLLVGRRRLTPAIAGGILLLGVPLIGIAVGQVPIADLLLLAAAGTGRSLLDIAGRTLLQRIVADQVLSRVFGLLEGLYMGALAVGSAGAAALVHAVGIRGAFVVAGAVLPVLVVVAWRPLARVDAAARVPAEAIALLRSVPMFAPLAPPTLERLASNLSPVSVPAGTVIIREGDAGDRFFVVAEGEARVRSHGQETVLHGAGACFGEIALLRDVPRTATVTAGTDMLLYSLRRDVFLESVTGHPMSLEAADELIRDRMGN